MSRVSDKPYFLYVLWSERGRRFYIGISEDPARRLAQHNTSRGGWTARYRPWTLVHQEQFANYRLARQRELQLKQQKGGQGLFEMIGLRPDRFRSSSSGS